MMQRVATTVAAVLLVAGFAACGDDGGGGGDGDASPDVGDGLSVGDLDVPDECGTVPLTMRLEAGGEAAAGGATQEITDAVARRVPILPGHEIASDPDGLEAAQDEAAATDLALYTLYLADFVIDRSELTGFGFGEVRPEMGGGIVGALTIIPVDEGGFEVGDVVEDAELAYETTTTFTPLGLTVRSGADPDAFVSFSEVVGEVEIVALDDDQLCLDIDVELLDDAGELVAAATGVVAAPVVRAPRSFFFT